MDVVIKGKKCSAKVCVEVRRPSLRKCCVHIIQHEVVNLMWCVMPSVYEFGKYFQGSLESGGSGC